MKRLDLRVTELGLAPTRSKAQQMIRAGEIEIRTGASWRTCTDVSFVTDQARVAGDSVVTRYVSRGGIKLESALARTTWDVTGQRVLDVGLSTGGFTDCVLKHGAAAVLGVDVGHGQLGAALRAEPRLTSIEGLNARALADDRRVVGWCEAGLDLIVADLSFISLTLVIPGVAKVARAGTRALLLVKPQFETTAARLNRRGIVEDPTVFDEVRARVTTALIAHGFAVEDYFACAIKGQDGNQEFFVSGTRDS